MLSYTEVKVAGRNAMVTTATVFIAVLSLLAAVPISTIILLSRCVIMLYACLLSVRFLRVARYHFVRGKQYKRDLALESFLVSLGAKLQIPDELCLKSYVLLCHSPTCRACWTGGMPALIEVLVSLPKRVYRLYCHRKCFCGMDGMSRNFVQLGKVCVDGCASFPVLCYEWSVSTDSSIRVFCYHTFSSRRTRFRILQTD
jgi:hypothetical protein